MGAFVNGDLVMSRFRNNNRIWEVINDPDDTTLQYYGENIMKIKLRAGNPWINYHSGAYDNINPKTVFVGDERYVNPRNWKLIVEREVLNNVSAIL